MKEYVAISGEIFPELQGYEGGIVRKTEKGVWATFQDTCQAVKNSDEIIEWLPIPQAYAIAESILKAFFYVCYRQRVTLFISFDEIAQGKAEIFQD